MSRRPRLTLPRRLAFTITVAAASGCPSPSPTDGAAHDAVEAAMVDTGSVDVPATGDTGPAADVAEAGDGAPPAPSCTDAASGQLYECVPAPLLDGMPQCTPRFVCDRAACGSDCVACAPGHVGMAGYYCRRDPSVDASSVACPSERVCSAADCPSGCLACVSPLRCLPDPERDAMAVSCAASSTCTPSGCGPGCVAVG